MKQRVLSLGAIATMNTIHQMKANYKYGGYTESHGKQTLPESHLGRHAPYLQNGNCLRAERASARGGATQVSLSFAVDLCGVVHVHQLSLGTRTDQLRATRRITGHGDLFHLGKDVRAVKVLFMGRGFFFKFQRQPIRNKHLTRNRISRLYGLVQVNRGPLHFQLSEDLGLMML